MDETRQWLAKNRVFRSDDPTLEVSVNAPFELTPKQPTGKGILLIHGLSDSPYSFTDVADHLAKEGFLVRTVLLPGHGAKPADLMLPSIENWLELISHHTQLLASEVDEVWVGGFSTGANLALIEAYDNPNIAGALLFSPAIYSRKPLDFLAPYAKYVMDWADIDPEVSITRFDSLTMNAAALYYQTSRMVRDRIESRTFTRPVLFTISESDSVIDAEKTFDYFNTRFDNEHNKMLWFGERTFKQNSVVQYSMILPEKRISTASHMSVLYSPLNEFYGEQGSIRICNNGQTEAQEIACNDGAETWFSSFDYSEEGKIYARLTWNPYFKESMAMLSKVIKSNSR